jgi:signal transduction histidine kinase
VKSVLHEVPEDFLAKWQNTTNVMADIFEVPAGLIMRVLPEQIEVLVSSHTSGNPYETDEKANLNTGLYCETVMKTRTMLHVPDALADPRWSNNPDVALNMISYLGVPLVWPDNAVFGTICVLDSKRRDFERKYAELLWEIKKGIEADFQVILQQERLIASNAELQTALESLTRTQADLLRVEKRAALGSLVVGIAHELNTPIGNAVLAASTLQDRAKAFSSGIDQGLTRSHMHAFVDTVAQGADMLMRSLGRATELVDNFKQIAADQSSANRRRFRLKDIVDESLSMLEPSIAKSGCQVRCTVPEDIEMDSDPGALGQVLANLIANALLHAFEGRAPGTVSLNAELVQDHAVRITVSDDGVGIPDANLERIFDPFFTTRLGQGGSGLGLHAAYNLVTGPLKGSIEVHSVPGHGARFTMLLPCVPEH